jgi:hypothetical protein
VLTEVGGTFQGVGFEEHFLLVSERQYTALVEAGVAAPKATDQAPKGGKESRKSGQR